MNFQRFAQLADKGTLETQARNDGSAHADIVRVSARFGGSPVEAQYSCGCRGLFAFRFDDDTATKCIEMLAGE